MSAKIIATYISKRVSANEDILDPTPQAQHEASGFRIFVCADTAGVLKVKVGGELFELNEGNNLTANALYAFDVVVAKHHTFNLQYSTDAVFKYLCIVEMKAEEL